MNTKMIAESTLSRRVKECVKEERNKKTKGKRKFSLCRGVQPGKLRDLQWSLRHG